MIRTSLDESQFSFPPKDNEREFDVISITESIKKPSLDAVIRRDKSKTFSFKYKTNNRNSRASIVSEISNPVDVQRQVHVYHNSDTGALEGLPLSWIRALNTDQPEEEQVKCVYEVHPIDKTFNERLRRQSEKSKKSAISTFQRIKSWFGRKTEREIPSFPTEFHHTVHVTKNPKTGEFEGLPSKWLQELAR